MNLKYIKSVTWDEVFSSWEKEEAELPHWIQHYKDRGFNSWREWRSDSVKLISPQRLNWKLYEVQEPFKTIPTFHAGPFRAWIRKYYDGKQTITFEELATNYDVQNDLNINEIIKKFPNTTTLIGLLKNSEIIIIEGLHRCCAVAVAQKKSINIDANFLIMCAEYPEELPILGQANSPT